MSLASHGGHGQVEIFEVRPCPFDLGLRDGEEAGTGLDFSLLPRHCDESWLTCHSNCHYTLGYHYEFISHHRCISGENHVSQNIPCWLTALKTALLNCQCLLLFKYLS